MTKFQTKFLENSVVEYGEISELEFKNLDPEKTYELSIHFNLRAQDGFRGIELFAQKVLVGTDGKEKRRNIANCALLLPSIELSSENPSRGQYQIAASDRSFPFTNAMRVIFELRNWNPTEVDNDSLIGGGTAYPTKHLASHATLYELNGHERTDKW